MKLLVFLTLMLALSQNLIGQVPEVEWVSLNYSDEPLISVIRDVEERTDYTFYFKPDWIKGKIVSLNLVDEDPKTAIQKLLDHCSVNHVMRGKKVILTESPVVTNIPINRYQRSPGQTEDFEAAPSFPLEKSTMSEKVESDDLHIIGSKRPFDPGMESTLTGFLRTGEEVVPLEGALVYIQEPFKAVTSDENGFYSLSVPNGRQTLFVQSVNTADAHLNLVIYSDGNLNISLEEKIIRLDQVEVREDREFNVRSTVMGLTRIDAEESKVIPMLLGEQDLLKVATTTTGVQKVGEGAAGINVRGGKADQNLFQLDGLPIYNPSHFFGFFSVVNADVVEGMEVYKSGIPVKYGGRLSAIFDISSKAPKTKGLSGKAGIGPVTSKGMLEGTLWQEGPSLLLGGRATYSNVILRTFKRSSVRNNRVAFHDAISRVTFLNNIRNKLSVTAYHSYDSYMQESDTLLSFTDFSYRNALIAIAWDHTFNDRFKASLNTGLSHYDYRVGQEHVATQAFDLDYDVREYPTSLNVDYFITEDLGFNFGLQTKYYDVNPGIKSPIGQRSLIEPDAIDREQGVDISPYFSTTAEISTELSIDAGLRYSVFSVLGPMEVFGYAEGLPRTELNRQDTSFVNRHNVFTSYHGPEWRTSVRYAFDRSMSIKGSYNRTRQNIHLLLNAATIAPTDIWRLSGPYIKPQIADQYSLGLYKNFYGDHVIETSMEFYYKDIQNLLDFRVGADLSFNKTVETEVLQGIGKSYGLEWSLSKTNGWLTGWLNYTYSRSFIRIAGDFPNESINGGHFFRTGYDKPHYINTVTTYKFSRRYSMSLNTVFASGVPITVPVGRYEFQDIESIYYSNRNQYRIPPYFRIDLGFNIEGNHKLKKIAHSFWTFSVYNLLGRDNIYSVFFTVEEGLVKAKKLTVFANPVPTLTYNFSF